MANQENGETRLVGLLAQFDDPDSLLHAGEAARVEGGYTKMDAFTPFPVHGIDQAIGIKRTILPFIVLFVGLHALVGAILLQWYANAGDFSPIFPGYDFRISGKPEWSLPANIPVVFEIIVLSSAFAAFFGMLILNQLPRLANPLHRISRFKRATNDRFFLVIEEKDAKFDLEATRAQLNEWGAVEIEEVHVDMSDQKMPAFLKMVVVTVLMLLLIPPVLIYRARGLTSRSPRLHVVPDMDWQYKYEAQELGPDFLENEESKFVFPHQRAAQEQLVGTVARGERFADVEFMTGIAKDNTVPNPNAIPTSRMLDPAKPESAGQEEEAPPEPKWLTKFPASAEVNTSMIERGRNRFNIYCAVCHGYGGQGDGLVNQRAVALSATGKAAWTTAKSLHDETVVDQPVGRIFDTITNGRGTMGPYKDQITAEDRWAIVLYVKALQETRRNEEKPPAPAEDGDAGDKKE